MRHLLKYFRPYLGQFGLLLVMVYFMVAATLALPDYMATIINAGIVGRNTAVIWHNGLIMLAFTFAATACSVLIGWLTSHIAAGFARDVRAALFAKVEGFSLTEFNAFSTASLITRTTNDVQQIMTVMTVTLRLALIAPFMGVWAIVKAWHYAPSMTWIMGLAVASLMAVIVVLFAVAVPRFTRLQKLVDRLNLVSREILTGLRVIRAFNCEPSAERKFDVTNAELTRINLFVNRLLVTMQPVMMLIMNLTSLAVIWYGARLIDLHQLEIGQMMAFMQYAIQAIFSFMMMTMVFVMAPRAAVSADRLGEVLATEASIKDPTEPVEATARHDGKVKFEHVTFAYAGAEAPVLHNLNFTASPGQVTAFVGSTGSGKSTVVNLIPRFYDVTTGTITIDGVDIRDFRLEGLYAKIGYVPQQGVLFSGTVESNLKYGAPHATEAEVREAAAVAQAKEFVEQLAGQYQAEISQGGTNVSGGQKQRLSIARAIIRRPEIYIFDDSFSALDFATDAKLRQALAAATKDKTVLIVAQRISTIMNADKIIVLDEGRIVGQGTHGELMVECPLYREIASSQLSEQELKKVSDASLPKAL
jgi:ATP-binding cassette subfamily B protein